MGGLNLYARHEKPFDPSTVELAETFAGYAAIALANAAALADATAEVKVCARLC